MWVNIHFEDNNNDKFGLYHLNQFLNHKLIWKWDKISSLLHIILLEVFGNIPHIYWPRILYLILYYIKVVFYNYYF